MLTQEDISILERTISKKNREIFSKVLEKNDPDTITILKEMAANIKYAQGELIQARYQLGESNSSIYADMERHPLGSPFS